MGWRRPVSAAAISAGLVVLQLRDPHVAGSWPQCPVLAATGWFCPGCGAMRTLGHLSRGDVAGAVADNVVVVAALVAALLSTLWWWRRGRSRQPWSRSAAFGAPGAALGWLVVVAAFTVLRNTAVPWLAPG